MMLRTLIKMISVNTKMQARKVPRSLKKYPSPVALSIAAPTPSKRQLKRFGTSPFGTTLDFKNVEEDVNINAKRLLSDICMIVIDSKAKG